MKLSLSTTDLPVPVDVFARERDSAAFRTFLGKVLKRGSQTAWEEEWAEGEQRVVRLATSLDLSQYIPEHAQRQLEGICDHAQLREVLRYSSSPVAGGDHRAEVTITPPFIGNTAKVNLVVTVLPVDARTCRQALDADVEVSIPGIGGVAEQSIADSLEQQYELLPEIVRRWAAFRSSLRAAKPGAEEQAGLLSSPPPLESLSADVRAELQRSFELPPKDAQQASAQHQQQRANSGRSASSSRSSSPGPHLFLSRQQLAAHQQQVAQRLARAGVPRRRDSRDEAERFYDASPVSAREETLTAAADIQPTRFHDAEAAWHWQCEQFVGDDEVTSACMHGDRRRADEWRAGWAGPVPRVSLRPDQALSAQQLPQQQQQQQRSSSGSLLQQKQQQQQAGPLSPFGPDFNAASAEWSRFWDEAGVQPAEVPNLQTRLSYLFGLASVWGFLKRHGAPDTPPPSCAGGMERERSCSSVASTGTEAMEVDSPALGSASGQQGGVRLEEIGRRLQIICEHDEALDASSSPASSL